MPARRCVGAGGASRASISRHRITPGPANWAGQLFWPLPEDALSLRPLRHRVRRPACELPALGRGKRHECGLLLLAGTIEVPEQLTEHVTEPALTPAARG